MIDLEAQVLRDGQPLTRPTRWASGLDSFEPGKLAVWKLFPGSVNNGESVIATVHGGQSPYPHWINVMALIAIDGIAWPEPMPGLLWCGEGGVNFNAAIHFPVMSHLPTFRGVHTLLLRTIVTKDQP